MATGDNDNFADYYVVPSLSGTEAGDTRSGRRPSPAWRKMYAKPVLARGGCPNPSAHLKRGEFDPGDLSGFAAGGAPSWTAAAVKLYVASIAVQMLRGKSYPVWMMAPGAAMAVWAYADELTSLLAAPAAPSAPSAP